MPLPAVKAGRSDFRGSSERANRRFITGILLAMPPSPRNRMSRLQLVREQIIFARKYTQTLLDTVVPDDWFRLSPGGVTHIAWQVGHLAMAEYRLALERIRGHQPEDAELISQQFMLHFRRESIPNEDASVNPSIDYIKAVLERVHHQAVREIKTLSEDDLDAPVLMPHPLFDTKLGCLLWCAQHEMLHAGQIGLLRRLLGHEPLW